MMTSQHLDELESFHRFWMQTYLQYLWVQVILEEFPYMVLQTFRKNTNTQLPSQISRIESKVIKSNKLSTCFLVSGFNPFEKYLSFWIISPARSENKKYFKQPPSFLLKIENFQQTMLLARGQIIYWVNHNWLV